MQFIPARGRKLVVARAGVTIHIIAIYPREGTETLGVGGVSRNLPIAIYPREGTETLFPLVEANRSLTLQFIPARGWKLKACRVGFNISIAIYPREGTETPMGAVVMIASFILQFIPARGRKPEAQWRRFSP